MLGALGGVTIVALLLQAVKGSNPMSDSDGSLSWPLLVFWLLYTIVAVVHTYGVPGL